MDGEWTGWTKWTLWTAALLAGAVEALGEAAFGLKIFGEPGDLPVEKRAGHSDEDVRRIGRDLPVGRSISSMPHFHGPAGILIDVAAAAVHQIPATGIVPGPQEQVFLAEEVLIVEEQFFETGPEDSSTSQGTCSWTEYFTTRNGFA